MTPATIRRYENANQRVVADLSGFGDGGGPCPRPWQSEYVSDEDECIHLNSPALCTICNGKDAAGRRTVRATSSARAVPTPKTPRTTAAKTSSKRLTSRVVATRSADTEESVEQYRSAYANGREATFEAYVTVFFATEARDFPGGFLGFSRCANAEPERKETAPALVARAERLMRAAGYEAEEVTGVGMRRWRPA